MQTKQTNTHKHTHTHLVTQFSYRHFAPKCANCNFHIANIIVIVVDAVVVVIVVAVAVVACLDTAFASVAKIIEIM